MSKNIRTNILLNLFSNKRLMYIYLSCIFSVFFSLTFFQYPYADESYYLLETANISNVLLENDWIGNYGVGLHGFLFKLPVALLFMIFGNSVFIASLYNIFLSLLCIYFFIKIIKNFFDDELFLISSVILLTTNMFFIITSVSFLREIPVLLSLLLFINNIIKDKSKFIIGLSLLLIVDAKEHVFFQIVPGLLIWIMYTSFIGHKNEKGNIIGLFVRDCLFFFTPAILYFILMFTTKVIPINMFIAYIFGLIEKGFTRLLSSFNSYGGISEYLLNKSLLCTFFNITLTDSYLIKFFYPTVISIQTFPKIIVIPSIIISFITLHNIKNNKYYFFLFLIFWSYFSIFYFRASHGRYLFSILPLFTIYFLLFLKDLEYNKMNCKIIIITVLTILIGILFEYRSIFIKIVLNSILLVSLILFLFNAKYKILKRSVAVLMLSVIIGLITFSISMYYTFITGKGKYSLVFGNCGEISEVANAISSDNKCWINDDSESQRDIRLIRFYKNYRINNPEWKWNLLDWVPKKNMIIHTNEENIQFFPFQDYNELRIKLLNNKINKIFIMVSLNDSFKFYKQNEINIAKNQNYLSLEKILNLKNRKVYVFDVKAK